MAHNDQNLAQNGQFCKLCLISQKLSDNFISNYRIKGRLMMTFFCSENAILIELAKIGEKWAILQNLPNFSKSRVPVTFLLILYNHDNIWKTTMQ